jgi:enoyl-CoA hydratase/carnithine racemase
LPGEEVVSHKLEVSRPAEAVAVVTFSDPGRGNQICWAAAEDMAAALADCRGDGVRVAIMASGLPAHWLEHAWLGDLMAGLRGEEQTASGGGWFRIQEELGHEELISIAAISGDCAGGGAEIGWACDLRIAERQARFCQPEVDLGLTTGIGGCSRLARLAGQAIATEMVLTGRPMSAQRLHAVGAINRVVDTGQALDAALELAAKLVVKPPLALAGLKKILALGEGLPLSEALATEQEIFQSVVVSDRAMDEMQRAQARYDAGESVADVGDYEAWKDL